MERTMEQVKAELDALRVQDRRYSYGINEDGDGFNPHSAALRTLQAEYDALAEAAYDRRLAALTASQEQEWTLEVTRQRRQEWNAWVRSQGPTMHPATVAERITEQGWSTEELRQAIRRHGL